MVAVELLNCQAANLLVGADEPFSKSVTQNTHVGMGWHGVRSENLGGQASCQTYTHFAT